MVNYMNSEAEKEMESNVEDMGELIALLQDNYAQNAANNPSAWKEAMNIYYLIQV